MNDGNKIKATSTYSLNKKLKEVTKQSKPSTNATIKTVVINSFRPIVSEAPKQRKFQTSQNSPEHYGEKGHLRNFSDERKTNHILIQNFINVNMNNISNCNNYEVIEEENAFQIETLMKNKILKSKERKKSFGHNYSTNQSYLNKLKRELDSCKNEKVFINTGIAFPKRRSTSICELEDNIKGKQVGKNLLNTPRMEDILTKYNVLNEKKQLVNQRKSESKVKTQSNKTKLETMFAKSQLKQDSKLVVNLQAKVSKPSKTAVATNNNSRTNSVEKLAHNKKPANNMFRATNIKNSLKYSINNSTNTSSTLLSNNKQNFNPNDAIQNHLVKSSMMTMESKRKFTMGTNEAKIGHVKRLSEIPFINFKGMNHMPKIIHTPVEKINLDLNKNKKSIIDSDRISDTNRSLFKKTSLAFKPVSNSNSKSASRIEEILDHVTKTKDLKISTGRKFIPVTTSHSPTNLKLREAKDFLNKVAKTKKISKTPAEFGISTKINTNLNKENVKILQSDNKQKDNNILDQSCISIIRESNYYMMESDNISSYIKKYYEKNGEYPTTDINFYKYGRLLGRGAFGKVNLSLHCGVGRLVAVKSFNKNKINSDNARRKILHETNILKNLNHPYIVKLYETFETSKHILIVMEYVCGGDLLSFIRRRTRLNEASAKPIFKQIIEALDYIHSNGIVHRDIKLDNILIDLQNNIKICDFGVSKFIKPGELMKEQCGTPAYIAPEILKNQGYEGFSVDIWSTGVVLYAMLTGTVPFKANNMKELHKMIMKGQFQPIVDLSEEASSLLYSLLEVDPKKRFTIDKILDHPWMNNADNRMKFKINLFTAAEKLLLVKSNIDYRKGNKEDLIENFSLRNLDTLQEAENQNVNTKSVILAPFNSSLKHESFKYEDLAIANSVLKINGKVRELNRNYELNNNGEIDNGVIISPQDSISSGNLIPPFEPSPFNNSLNNKGISKPLSPKTEKNSKITSPREEELSKRLKSQKFTIDENILREVVDLGYSKEYIVKGILRKEANYATTAYFLLLNSKASSSSS